MSKTVMIKQKRLKGYLQNFNVFTNNQHVKFQMFAIGAAWRTFNVFARKQAQVNAGAWWILLIVFVKRPDSGFRQTFAADRKQCTDKS